MKMEGFGRKFITTLVAATAFGATEAQTSPAKSVEPMHVSKDTLYVQNENDPRLLSYEDSVALNEIQGHYAEVVKNHPKMEILDADTALINHPKYAKLKAHFSEKGISSWQWLQYGEKVGVHHEPKTTLEYDLHVSPEPVQPVAYRPEQDKKIAELRTEIQSQLSAGAVSTIDSSQYPSLEIYTFDPTLKNPREPKIVRFENEQQAQDWIKENANHLQKLGGGSFLDRNTIPRKE